MTPIVIAYIDKLRQYPWYVIGALKRVCNTNSQIKMNRCDLRDKCTESIFIGERAGTVKNHICTFNFRTWYKLLRNIFVIQIIICSTSSYSIDGLTCVNQSKSGLPNVVDSTYLQNSTVYGLVQNVVNITARSCLDQNTQNLELCVGSAPCLDVSNNNICTDPTQCFLATITPGTPLSLTNPAQYSALNVTLFAELISNKLCVAMDTSRGRIPLLCKTILLSPAQNTPATTQNECTVIPPVCTTSDNSASISPLSFTGPAYQCLTETLNNILFGNVNCANPNENMENTLTSFYTFQVALRQSVYAALLLYTIFYGMRLALGAEKMEIQSASVFVLKMIFVIYCAVGMTNASGKKENGIVEYFLPVLLQSTQGFSDIVLSAFIPQGLCAFNISDYPSGQGQYALWDSIDCRIAYYLGMGIARNAWPNPGPTTTISPTANNNGGQAQGGQPAFSASQLSSTLPFDGFALTNFGFFGVLLGLALGGQLIAMAAGLVFVIIFISILIQVISTYLVCIITLYLLIYLSPIFVPMVLFSRTKGYFDAWLKVCVSCALQPVIMIAFVGFLLSMFDTALYDNCEFIPQNYLVTTLDHVQQTTIQRTVRTFIMTLPSSDPDQCQSSAGYILMTMYMGDLWHRVQLSLVQLHLITAGVDVMLAFIKLLSFSFIFYFFSQIMIGFASEVTGGPSLAEVTNSISNIVGKISEKREQKKDKDTEKRRQTQSKGKGGAGGKR